MASTLNLTAHEIKYYLDYKVLFSKQNFVKESTNFSLKTSSKNAISLNSNNPWNISSEKL